MVSGRSGTELVMDILGEFWDDFEAPNPLEGPQCSPEYWSGWILAYYQWRKGDSFESILKKLPMRDILQLYPVLHEASEEKFIDTADSIIRRKTVSTRLQQLRRIGGYSQRLLSEKSGVNLRTLQQYEIGAKISIKLRSRRFCHSRGCWDAGRRICWNTAECSRKIDSLPQGDTPCLTEKDTHGRHRRHHRLHG